MTTTIICPVALERVLENAEHSGRFGDKITVSAYNMDHVDSFSKVQSLLTNPETDKVVMVKAPPVIKKKIREIFHTAALDSQNRVVPIIFYDALNIYDVAELVDGVVAVAQTTLLTAKSSDED